ARRGAPPARAGGGRGGGRPGPAGARPDRRVSPARPPASAYVWLACDTATTRALTAYLRKDLGLQKQRVHALGYWRPA
ncbi:SIP domain-containing protein, partial [Streptomyces lavendulae]|uniref:SIP domain-containing protein n=1 Tax=Streptomyces lavendulae TaxID=1914 RepID=UPI00369CC68A